MQIQNPTTRKFLISSTIIDHRKSEIILKVSFQAKFSNPRYSIDVETKHVDRVVVGTTQGDNISNFSFFPSFLMKRRVRARGVLSFKRLIVLCCHIR